MKNKATNDRSLAAIMEKLELMSKQIDHLTRQSIHIHNYNESNPVNKITINTTPPQLLKE